MGVAGRHRWVAVAAALLVPAGPAAAAPPPQNPVPSVSAIDQYIEAIPTSAGPVPTGRSGAKPRPLPQAVAATVRARGGADAQTLLDVATSPVYGGPVTRQAQRPVAEPQQTTTPQSHGPTGVTGGAESKPPSVVDAVVSPVAEAEESRLFLLLGVLAAMTVAAAAVGISSRRGTTERTRPPV